MIDILDKKVFELESLCGGMLATFILNYERGYFHFDDSNAQAFWEKELENWRKRYKELKSD